MPKILPVAMVSVISRNGGGLLVLLLALTAPLAWAEPQPAALDDAFQAIDGRHPGALGVYVKRLDTGEEVRYQAGRDWYLASTVKVPLAVAVLQAVEAGRLSLDEQMTLKESHYVDGAGDLLWHEPGAKFSIAELIQKSIENSDSTATDMLMTRLGVDAFNDQIREAMVAEGFHPFTTILQVRYDAYGQLHPHAAQLSNMDYVEIRSAGAYDARVRAFMSKLGLERGQLQAETLEQAFARYYESQLNSGTLLAFGKLLERLVTGQLLNETHTRRVLEHMTRITTGDTRLKAGLPKELVFAQKTGTQIKRACNVGVVNPLSPEKAVIVAACAQGYDDLPQAERQFQQTAAAIARAGWVRAQ